MRYALLYNPIAGRGRAATAAAEAIALLESAGHQVREGRSKRAGHIAEMSAALAEDVDRLLALGGDGSLREAAAGLLASGEAGRVALGVLPLGTGNVVAREAGLPLDPVAAARGLDRAEEWRIDVGWARAEGGSEAELFLAMAGFGYDAAVAERVDRARSVAGSFGARWYRRSADTLYGCIAASEMVRPRPARFAVEIDGVEASPSAAALVASNVCTYGKGMEMVPGAAADDGVLGYQLRERGAPWATAASLVAAQLRLTPPRWAARTGEARCVTVRTQGGPSFPWQLDGDPMGRAASVELRLEPGALTLLRANGSGGPDAR
ncbi:MAG: diacylglycerol kinase family protein [Planctomycetota bacterium]|nr:diacylglycerol kinase family protein [Planctomycetota bacterium]